MPAKAEIIDQQITLLTQAPCGIFSFSDEGVISICNVFCEEILGYDKGELTGRNIASLLTISGRIFYQTHFYPLVKLHKHIEEIFLNLQSKSKTDVPVVLNAIATYDGTGQIICSFIPVFNRRKYEDEILLAKKSAEEALQKNESLEKIKQELEVQQKELDRQINLLKFQNKELLQLNDIIAHDLQEPVRKLILFATELQKENGEVQFKEYALTVIKKSSVKIKNLLLNLQSYMALTEPLTLKDNVDINKLIQEELEQLRQNFPQTEVTLTCETIPAIKGNKNQLKLMFHHLLKNAFNYGSINNKLHLNIDAVTVKENLYNSLEHRYKWSDFARITIWDKGPGFEEQYNDYVFDVLKRVDLSVDSLGFGLAFCKRITENHHGSIRAKGKPGSGASFTIMLPIENVPAVTDE